MSTFSHLHADGSYNCAAIMRGAWRGRKIWGKPAPLAGFLRSEWQRAQMQRSLFDEMAREAAMTAEERAEHEYFKARFSAYAAPLLNQAEYRRRMDYADSIRPASLDRNTQNREAA